MLKWLHKWLSYEPKLKRPVETPPEPTIVHLRSNSTPVQWWDARVYYDAWGTPYILGRRNGSRATYGSLLLKSDGRTDSVWDVQWMHKSGPPVKFAPKPENRFEGWNPNAN